MSDPTSTRQRGLDGLRGLAIASVVAYHHGILSLGWIGVDLFFVLSGFLITRILMEDREDERYWARFYLKRAGRILLPPLVLIPLAAILTGHIRWTVLLGYFFFLGSYIDVTKRAVWSLQALWSLSVEEHFYLIWPLFIRYLRRRTCVYRAPDGLARGAVIAHSRDWTFCLTGDLVLSCAVQAG